MKRLILTKFFTSLQKASKKGIDINMKVLRNEYEEFAILVFSESLTSTDKTTYHNILVYTCMELSGLTDEAKKNTAIYLRKAIELVDQQIKWVEQLILAEQNASNCPICKRPQSQALEWTGTQMELVELIYALNEAGCFGDISLKKLFCIIEQVVGCEVKNHYRLFWDIRNRTGEERTYFLNKLIKKLSEKLIRMDSEN